MLFHIASNQTRPCSLHACTCMDPYMAHCRTEQYYTVSCYSVRTLHTDSGHEFILTVMNSCYCTWIPIIRNTVMFYQTCHSISCTSLITQAVRVSWLFWNISLYVSEGTRALHYNPCHQFQSASGSYLGTYWSKPQAYQNCLVMTVS